MKSITRDNRFWGALDMVRIIIMGGVVLIHSNIARQICSFPNLGLAADFSSFVSSGLCSVCVPMFFFISGMLFYRNWQFSWPAYRRKFKSRVKSLLVPYLIWCFVGMIVFLAKASSQLAPYFPSYALADTSFPRILAGFWAVDLIGFDSTYPFDFALWFLRDLLVCIALVPVLNWLLKLRWIWIVGLLFLMPYSSYGLWKAFFFFSLGAVCSVSGINVVEFSARRAVWVTSLALFFIYHLVIFMLGLEFGIPWVLFTVIGFMGIFGLGHQMLPLRTKPLTRLVSSSLFFVYAFHALWVTVLIHAVLGVIRPENSFMAIVCYLMVFVIHWLVGITLFYALRRAFPRFASIITGGRSAA